VGFCWFILYNRVYWREMELHFVIITVKGMFDVLLTVHLSIILVTDQL